MSTRHLVDPELAAALEVLPPFELSASSLAATRELMKGFAPPKETYQREDVVVEQAAAPGLNGAPEVPLIIYRPKAAKGPLPAILFIHGGGYVFGTAETGAPACTEAAAERPCVVVSVDDRLAPEAPAPAPVEDCYAG